MALRKGLKDTHAAIDLINDILLDTTLPSLLSHYVPPSKVTEVTV